MQRDRSKRAITALGIVAATAVAMGIGYGLSSYLAAAPSAPRPDSRFRVVPPARKPRAAPPSLSLPSLPAGCAQPPEYTAEVRTTVEGAPGAAQRKRISRAAHVVHVRLGDAPLAPEWVFFQNRVDPRRVQGTLIDHAQRVLLEHDDSALRNSGIAASWAEVVSLGLAPAALAALVPVKTRPASYAGLDFIRYSVHAKASPAAEVLWNHSSCLPLRITIASSPARSSELVALAKGIDRELLQDPRRRFPDYRVVDAIDWLEQHHESTHGEGVSHAQSAPHGAVGVHAAPASP